MVSKLIDLPVLVLMNRLTLTSPPEVAHPLAGRFDATRIPGL
jgi:hypothetical protein